MVRFLFILALALASAPAHAQSPRVTQASDCRTFNSPCNAPPHSSVVEALRLPEGSAARYQAEICRLLPSAEQERCMAQWREEASHALQAPATVTAAVPTAKAPPPEEASSSRCDFVGAQSMGRIRDALERCAEVTVTVDGRVFPYTKPAAPAPSANCKDAKGCPAQKK